MIRNKLTYIGQSPPQVDIIEVEKMGCKRDRVLKMFDILNPTSTNEEKEIHIAIYCMKCENDCEMKKESHSKLISTQIQEIS